MTGPTDTTRFFDHHCHLEPGEAAAGAVAAALQAGVTRLVTVGTDPERSLEAAAVARSHPGVVWATAGIHPHDAAGGGLEVIEALQADEVVLAVGECGLDYYYEHSPRRTQQEVFAAQVSLANRLDRALVIHTRDAWEDTFAVLREVGVPDRLVFHCFTGGVPEAVRCLDLGAVLSFSGIVTFKTADLVRAAAVACPLDRILLETDAPYLAPVPLRGKRNEPAYVVHTAAAVAALKGVAIQELAACAWANTNRFYGLAP